MEALIDLNSKYKEVEKNLISAFSKYVVYGFPNDIVEEDIALSPYFTMVGAKLFGVNVSIWSYDTESEISSKCKVCNGFDSDLSDEEILKQMKQSKIDLEKRIEIALFINKLLKDMQQAKDD